MASIMDMASGLSRGASERAKNMSDVSNLKRKIIYEEERIMEIFADIGRMYYKTKEENKDQLIAYCEDIDVRRRRIKKMRFEMNEIRGYKVCPKCNAEVNGKFQFCGVCGAKIVDPNDDDYEDVDSLYINRDNKE